MLRKLLFTMAVVAAASVSFAQGYYTVPIAGSPDIAAFPGSGAVKQLVNANTAPNKVVNNFMSSAQNIPFEFSFYGETVTQYIVSENGYISFDVSETTSNGTNETLPSTSAPKKAIFAFWDDLDLRQNSNYLFSINTWTYGEAGNRTHVINWFQSSSASSSSQDELYIFSIRLHESGAFDIVYESDYVFSGKSQFSETATVGIQNGDGTEGINIAGPEYTYPTGVTSGVADDIVYRFLEGDEQPEYNVAILSNDVPATITKGLETKFNIEIINYGSKAISSIDYEYTVNAGTPISGTASVVLLGTGKSQTINIGKGFSLADGGETAEIDFQITKVNGEDDASMNDNTFTASSLSVLGISATKKVLIEEFSTAPCGYCPDGALVLDAIKANNPNVIVAQHHAGYGTDRMTIPEHSTYATAFATGAPTATIDRVYYQGQSGVAISRNLWESKAIAELATTTPVKVEVTSKLDDETNTLTADVNVEFVDYSAGDLRVTVFVIQKMLQGSGNGYDQVNYYNNTAGHAFYAKGNPIPGYWHKDVTRDVLSDEWGDKLDGEYAPGAKFSKNYSYKVNPAKDDKSMLEVVAFVNLYDPNTKKHHVLNAEEMRIASNVNQVSNNINAIYPNPTNGMTTVDLTLDNNAQVAVTVMNSVGQEVSQIANDNFNAGNHTLTFDASTMEKGVYFVNVVVDGVMSTQKLIVQ